MMIRAAFNGHWKTGDEPSEPKPRQTLNAKANNNKSPREIKASYDAARDGSWLANFWANADDLSADSANSKEVRQKLVRRSRYECANNPYYAGALRTYATDIVGCGPLLRMQTQAADFNAMVEREFWNWAQEVKLAGKLRCMAHAFARDGEAIGVLRLNRGLKHTVKLDLVLYETEQCTTPFLPTLEPGYIDGIRFDDYGNPLWYDILPYHPGGPFGITYITGLEAEHVDARFVAHWFRNERPGQHRGVPLCSSSMNLGAAARRFREATVCAAESAARPGALMKTLLAPNSDDTPDVGEPFSTVSIPVGSLMQMPYGADVTQLKPEHPGSTFESFNKSLINEHMRPLSMPRNKAACDSSDYNYASGRLDHQTYYAELDVLRDDCCAMVLERVFSIWLERAILAFGWLGGDPDAVGPLAHTWDWPTHPVSDQKAQAFADDKNLRNGADTLPRVYARAGYDFDEEMQKAADAFGIPVEAYKSRLFDTLYPPAKAPAAPGGLTTDQQDLLDEQQLADTGNY